MVYSKKGVSQSFFPHNFHPDPHSINKTSLNQINNPKNFCLMKMWKILVLFVGAITKCKFLLKINGVVDEIAL